MCKVSYFDFMNDLRIFSTANTLKSTFSRPSVALIGIVRILSELLVVVRQELSLVGEEA